MEDKCCKRKLITTGEFSKKLWYIVIAAILKILRYYVPKIDEEDQDVTSFALFGFISEICAVFLEIIIKVRSKRHNTISKKESTEEKSFGNIIKQDIFRVNKRPNAQRISNSTLILTMIGLSFTYYIAYILENVIHMDIKIDIKEEEKKEERLEYQAKNQVLSLGKIFELIVVNIFLVFKFNKEFHRHHAFSYILLLIGSILITGFSIEALSEVKFKIFYSLGYLLFGFAEIIVWWLSFKKYVSIYKVLYLNGIFMTIIAVVVSLPVYFSCKNRSSSICKEIRDLFDFINFFKGIKDKVKYSITIVLYTILSFGYNTFVFISIYELNPTYWIFNDYFANFIIVIVDAIITISQKKWDKGYFYFIVLFFGYFIMSLGVFFFNELLIFHACGLDEGVNEKFNKEQMTEDEVIKEDIDYLIQNQRDIGVPDFNGHNIISNNDNNNEGKSDHGSNIF